jgi:cell division protein FtsB
VSPTPLSDRQQRRRQRALFIAFAIVLVVYGLVSGDHKPHHLAVLWLEEERTKDRIAELDSQRRELDLEKARLQSDTLALEALAREKGMIRPGDVVYRIVPVPPGVREAAAESLAVRAAREAAARAADSLRQESTRARRLSADSDRLDAPPSNE